MEAQKFTLGYRYYFGPPWRMIAALVLLPLAISLMFLSDNFFAHLFVSFVLPLGILYVFSVILSPMRAMHVTIDDQKIEVTYPSNIAEYKHRMFFWKDIRTVVKDGFKGTVVEFEKDLFRFDENLRTKAGLAFFEHMKARFPDKTIDDTTKNAGEIFKPGIKAFYFGVATCIIFLLLMFSIYLVLEYKKNTEPDWRHIILSTFILGLPLPFLNLLRSARLHAIALPDRCILSKPNSTDYPKQIEYKRIISVKNTVFGGVKIQLSKYYFEDTELCLQSPTETFYRFLMRKTGKQQ